MYVTGENPLLSEPNLHHAEETFRNLEFLVVQDIFLHETAQIADVVLPATSFAEKDGTFTNSERRVQRVRKAVEPIGESLPDWEIICDLARRMSRDHGLGLEDQFSYTHPSEIWQEMADNTPIIAESPTTALRKRAASSGLARPPIIEAHASCMSTTSRAGRGLSLLASTRGPRLKRCRQSDSR